MGFFCVLFKLDSDARIAENLELKTHFDKDLLLEVVVIPLLLINKSLDAFSYETRC